MNFGGRISDFGVLKNGGTNQGDIETITTCKQFVAQSPEAFSYDADGIPDQRRALELHVDAENRLVQMQTLTNLAASVPQQKLLFGYDYQGRRISKVVSNFNGCRSCCLRSPIHL